MKSAILQNDHPSATGPSNINGINEGIPRYLELMFLLLLIVFTLIPYWQTASFGFVNFDDPSYVYQNPLLADGLTQVRVKEAVFGFHEANWHPLVWLSYMAEIELFGMKPEAMHITNVILHIANALLVYLWLRRSTGEAIRSFLAAVVFAVHPLHVESVAWITERKDVLSTLFLLGTLIAYSEYVRKRCRRWYLATTILFGVGLSAKGMLVTVPIMLVLVDFWPLNRFDLSSALRFNRSTLRNVMSDKIPFLMLSVAIACITILAQRSGGAVAGMTALSLNERIANATVSFSRYALKSFWPVNLSAFYPMPIGGWSIVIVMFSFMFLVMTSIAAWLARRQRIAILIGWCWFIVTLLPVIGIIQVGSQSMADRYMYVPMIGLSQMLLWGLPDRYFRLQGRSMAIFGLSIVALVIVSTRQVATWQDSITLFENALEVAPENNFTSHANLGMAYQEAGRMDEAEVQMEESVKVNPDNPAKVEILARKYIRDGKYKDGEDLLTKALRVHDESGVLWLLLGNAMKGQNEAEKAIWSYRKAVSLDSASSEALNNLGLMICRKDNLEGMKFIRQAILSNPANAQAHNSLGNALVREGHLAQAEKSYLEAIRLADLAESKKNLEYVRELLAQQAAPH